MRERFGWIANDEWAPRLAIAGTVPLAQAEDPVERARPTIANVEQEFTVITGQPHAPALLAGCHLAFGDPRVEAIAMPDCAEDAQITIAPPQSIDTLQNPPRKITHPRTVDRIRGERPRGTKRWACGCWEERLLFSSRARRSSRQDRAEAQRRCRARGQRPQGRKRVRVTAQMTEVAGGSLRW